MGQAMILSRFLARNVGLHARVGSCSRCLRMKNPFQGVQALRRNTSSSVSPAKATHKPTGKKPLLPERLLVFHAGTGRSVFLGSLKVTTIFICAFFSLVMAPAHFKSEGQPKWVAAGVMLSGIVPVVAVAYLTSPFVAHVHLRLPSFARYSREMVVRYSHTLPKDAKLELTTMNLVGMPRVTRVTVGDLRPTKRLFGIVNYVRDTKDLKKRPWYMGRPARQFGISSGVRIAQGNEVWENIEKTIAKRSV